jgi:tetratricopeptide (TPR) repeat protein
LNAWDTIIVGIIVGIAVLAIGWIARLSFHHARAAKRCFRVRWREAARIRAHDLLLARASRDLGFNNYYYEREQDKRMRDAVRSGSNVIVVGEPLSGKSRAVLEALRNLSDRYDVAVVREADFNDFTIPFHARRMWNQEIVVLDDIDRLAVKPGFLELLAALVKRHAVLIATCQEGEAHEVKFSQTIRPWESYFGVRIEVGLISPEVARRISVDADIEFSDSFYGPIGSLFLPVEALQREFRRCSREEKWVLESLRVLHISGAASLKEGIAEELLTDVIAAPEGPQLSGRELRTALDDLSARGFLKRSERGLQCEESLLENVVDSEIDVAEAVTQLVGIFRTKANILAQMGSTALNRASIDIEVTRLSHAAITAYEEALTIYTKDAFPMQYAVAQNNLGKAYRTLAEVQDKAKNCRAAITAHEEALTISTKDAFPMQYAATHYNLGNAYRTLAEVQDKAKNCRAAITACKEALTISTKDAFPMQYAMTQCNLGNAYWTLAEVEDKAKNCRAAIIAYEEALTIPTKDAFPMQYAARQGTLGNAYRTLAQVEDKAKNCRAAITAYEESLTIYTKDAFPVQYAMTQNTLGNAYETLAQVKDKAKNCRAAIIAYEEALTVLSLHQLAELAAVVKRNLQELMTFCGPEQ